MKWINFVRLLYAAEHLLWIVLLLCLIIAVLTYVSNSGGNWEYVKDEIEDE